MIYFHTIYFTFPFTAISLCYASIPRPLLFCYLFLLLLLMFKERRGTSTEYDSLPMEHVTFSCLTTQLTEYWSTTISIGYFFFAWSYFFFFFIRTKSIKAWSIFNKDQCKSNSRAEMSVYHYKFPWFTKQ